MRGQAGSSLWGYLTQLCPWGSCLSPSPPSRGLDGDVPAPRGLTCTSNSARPRPNSPPAQSRVGLAPNTHWVTLMGDVRGNDDKCQGDAGHTADSWKVALRPATRLRLPGLGPVWIGVPPTASPPQASHPVTAQLPWGYLRPLPALWPSGVTELPHARVLCSCLRATCTPLGVGRRALQPDWLRPVPLPHVRPICEAGCCGLA